MPEKKRRGRIFASELVEKDTALTCPSREGKRGKGQVVDEKKRPSPNRERDLEKNMGNVHSLNNNTVGENIFFRGQRKGRDLSEGSSATLGEASGK